jgi:outer membrane receptor protein involved in Fe transport
MRQRPSPLIAMALFGLTGVSAADRDAPIGTVSAEENIQVTATRYPEDSENLPTVVTVLDAQQLRDRGFTDLRSALGVVAGVDIAPGGDGGPASAIPEMWGLREFDAFLLVVDDVPWGGAFNPDLPTLSLQDVDRIEIMRGSAPVMYGATSFIGVIHVIHNAAGSGRGNAQALVGDHRSAGVNGAIDVSGSSRWSSRIEADLMMQGYPDERTDWQRAHVLWRNRAAVGGGHFRLDADLLWLDQSPSSPTPRVGTTLSPLVGPDDNVNPLGSHMDTKRPTITAGYDHDTTFGSWSVLASYAHSGTEFLRGFLDEDPTFPLTAAHGFRQAIAQDEVYFDGHLTFTSVKDFRIVAGVDTLWGRGRTHGGDFDYDVAPDGSFVPDGGTLPNAAQVDIADTRTFSGLYGYAAWTPSWRWRVDMGVRGNFTDEHRDKSDNEFGPPATLDVGSDSRSETKVSGGVGATFTMWRNKNDDARLFVNYRNTFKPAAIDFGLDSEVGILDPETGQSYELGARTALFDRKLDLELEAFQMDLSNIVVASDVGGTPGLENGGEQRLRGVELEARGRFVDGLYGRFAWSWHDSTFRDFEQDFGTGPVQLAGNRLEMVPESMGALGVIWAPKSGFTAHGEVRYTGSRYLDRRNTALAPGFVSWSAGIGWRMKSLTLRLDGENLSDRRDPVSESELGDGQYYLLPARMIWLSGNWQF